MLKFSLHNQPFLDLRISNQVFMRLETRKSRCHCTSHRIQHTEPFNRFLTDSVKWRLILPPPSSPVYRKHIHNHLQTHARGWGRGLCVPAVHFQIHNRGSALLSDPLLKFPHWVESNSIKFTSGEEYSNEYCYTS